MRKLLYLHIGTLKTGSKSVQRFLLDHADELSARGYALYRGEYRETNHLELDLASMRYERDSFAKMGLCKDVTIDASYTRRVADRVQSFLTHCREPRVIFTCEALCRLRYDDEIDRLKQILDVGRHEAKVILFLRNKDDFLRSYTAEIFKVPGRKPSSDPESALYVEPGTWLTDYESLVGVYERGFGAGKVAVIDYDNQMRAVGNVIPSFLQALGLAHSDPREIGAYFLNTSNPAERRMPIHGARRLVKRAVEALEKWRSRRAA